MKDRSKAARSHFKKVDPIIYNAMNNIDFGEWFEPDQKDKNSSEYFGALCREIIGQQLAGKASNAIFARFESLLKPSPVKPNKILSIESQKFRDIGMSWAKTKYVKDLAEKTLKKEIELENLDKLSDEKVVMELTKVKGIGPWTSEMFLIFTLGRENVFSHGDLGLKRGLEKLYNLKNPTKEVVENIVNPWSPYKTYGSITLWHTLDSTKE